MTYDNNGDKKVRIYKNATELSYATQTAGTGNLQDDSSWEQFIGTGTNSRYFNGLIDDVRIYNRVLSKDEIKRLYKIGGTAKVNTTLDGPQSGLVGWWSFDGKHMAGNRAFDASGQGNYGTLTGSNGLPVRTAGKIGQGLQFDGVDDYVRTTASSVFDFNSATNKSSWSAWIRPDDLHEYNAAWSPTHAASSAGVNIFALTTTGASLGPVTAGIVVQIISNNVLDTHSTNNVITVGSWYHVLVTYDRSLSATNRVTIYVNGLDVTDRSDVFNDGALSNFTDTNTLWVGNDNGSDFFHGAVDEVRSYNRVLSKDEIKRLYNAGR